MNWREDKTLIVLANGVTFFTIVTILVVVFWPNDGQLYTLFGSVFSQFAGALILHLKTDRVAPAGSTTVTNTAQVTTTPEEKP